MHEVESSRMFDLDGRPDIPAMAVPMNRNPSRQLVEGISSSVVKLTEVVVVIE